MLPQTFLQAKPIIEKIENSGHQAYYVGGCVRDHLLNKEIRDIDIASSASPEMIQQLFAKVIPIGVEHGTVVVRHEGESYEVTTFRLDGTYSDQRHPDTVKFIDRLEEDLKRRDFTMNALAMDKTGRIIDLFNGKQDLKDKVIRTVGSGEERFSEDPLRIIRAIRFSSQLGFSIEAQTVAAINKTKQDIAALAVERITNEFTKLFAGEFVELGINYIKETGISTYLPTFKQHPDLIHRLPARLPSLSSFGQVIALFHLLKQEVSVKRWIKDWRCSNETKKEAEILVWAYTHFDQNGFDSWLAYHLNEQNDQGFLNLLQIFRTKTMNEKEIKTRRESLPIQSRQELAVNGNDLMEWFPMRRQGPWLKDALYLIEKQVVTDKLKNSRDQIKEWLKWNLHEIN